MSVVRLVHPDLVKIGTGVVVQFTGGPKVKGTCLILTNHHVVDGRPNLTVLLPPNEQQFPNAYVQAEDASADLALVRLNNVNGNFQAMVFEELPNLVSFPLPVYLHSYFTSYARRPGRSPGQINGMFVKDNVTFFHGNYACEPGTSGSPVTMRGRVVAINCGASGGSSRMVSLLGIHMTLVAWCDFDNADHTIEEMLQKLV